MDYHRTFTAATSPMNGRPKASVHKVGTKAKAPVPQRRGFSSPPQQLYYPSSFTAGEAWAGSAHHHVPAHRTIYPAIVSPNGMMCYGAPAVPSSAHFYGTPTANHSHVAAPTVTPSSSYGGWDDEEEDSWLPFHEVDAAWTSPLEQFDRSLGLDQAEPCDYHQEQQYPRPTTPPRPIRYISGPVEDFVPFAETVAAITARPVRYISGPVEEIVPCVETVAAITARPVRYISGPVEEVVPCAETDAAITAPASLYTNAEKNAGSVVESTPATEGGENHLCDLDEGLVASLETELESWWEEEKANSDQSDDSSPDIPQTADETSSVVAGAEAGGTSTTEQMTAEEEDDHSDVSAPLEYPALSFDESDMATEKIDGSGLDHDACQNMDEIFSRGRDEVLQAMIDVIKPETDV